MMMPRILEFKDKHYVRGYPATGETPEELSYVEAIITKIETEDFYEESQSVFFAKAEGAEDDISWEVTGTIGERLDANGDEGPFIFAFTGIGVAGGSNIL